MTDFVRRIPALQELFPSSGRDTVRPQSASEVVQFVHEFPGRMFRLENVIRETITTAAALTPSSTGLGLPVTPQSQYDEMILGQISHNAGTLRTLRLGISDPAGALLFLGHWEGVTGGVFIPIIAAAAVNAAGFQVYPGRPIIPPGWTIYFDGDTAGAAYSVFLQFARIRKTLAEPAMGR